MRYGVTAAFADPLAGWTNAFGPLDSSHVRAWDLCPHAARRGWIVWRFKSVCLAPRMWRAHWIEQDSTLAADGRLPARDAAWASEPPLLDTSQADAHQHVWTMGTPRTSARRSTATSPAG